MQGQTVCSVAGCEDASAFVINRKTGSYAALRPREIPLPPDLISVCQRHLVTYVEWHSEPDESQTKRTSA